MDSASGHADRGDVVPRVHENTIHVAEKGLFLGFPTNLQVTGIQRRVLGTAAAQTLGEDPLPVSSASQLTYFSAVAADNPPIPPKKKVLSSTTATIEAQWA